MFFITNGRLTKNDFTLPFLSDKGLAIAKLETSKGSLSQRYRENVLFISKPFTAELWEAILVFLLLNFAFLLICENRNASQLDRVKIRKEKDLQPIVQEIINAEGEGYERRLRTPPEGYGTKSSFGKRIFYFFVRTCHAMIGNEYSTSDLTPEGRMLNLSMAVFSVILVNAYVASFVLVVSNEHLNTGTSVSTLIKEASTVCLPGDSAFTVWVQDAHPALKANAKIVRDWDEQVLGLKSGLCDALIAPITNIQAHENNDCDEVRLMEKASWAYGYMEHAIGTRNDFSELTDTLNYWIHELILSANDNKDSFTYMASNMHDMYSKVTSTTGECSRRSAESSLGLEYVASERASFENETSRSEATILCTFVASLLVCSLSALLLSRPYS